jgi:hypothetical protein
MELKDWINAIGTICAVGISLYALLYKRTRDKETDQTAVIADLRQDLNKACDRILTLEVHAGPWQKLLEKMALDILHHPTMEERDMLIDKYQTDEGLTRDETRHLLEMFRETIEDERAPAREVFAAMLMAARLEAQLKGDK